MKEQTGQFDSGAPARPWPARRSDRNLYGWRTLESQQWKEFAEAVTGFIKLDSKNSESILKLSGAKPLAKHRIPTNISWILQNKWKLIKNTLDESCHKTTRMDSLTAVKAKAASDFETQTEACHP